MVENQNPNLMRQHSQDYGKDSILLNSNCILRELSCTTRKQDSVDMKDDALYSTDEFRMYVFKIKLCNIGIVHDWTTCPFAHPGERARRRDPKKYPYSSAMCPEYKTQGVCARGHSCESAHGLFEFLLHPDRYKTKLCREGANCTRTVCFFAHTLHELRCQPRSPKSSLSPKLQHNVSNRLGQTGSRGNSEAMEKDLLMQHKQVMENLNYHLAAVSICQKQLQMLRDSGFNLQYDPLLIGNSFVETSVNARLSSGGNSDSSSNEEDFGWLDNSGSIVHHDDKGVAA